MAIVLPVYIRDKMAAMPEFIRPAGDMQPVPVDPAERCLNAVDAYVRHRGLGVAFGDVPLPLREEWRAIAATKPTMDTVTEYHWGWMCAELGTSILIYREPDNTVEAVRGAFRHSLDAFNGIAAGTPGNRFEKARADIASAAVPLYFDVITHQGEQQVNVTRLCERLGVGLKDMMAWYGRLRDPGFRKYLNSLSLMGLVNIGYMTGIQNEIVVTPAPSRYQEGLGEQFTEPSDADLWLWIIGRGNTPARVGQHAPGHYVKFDPLLLGNDSFQHTAGHTVGSAQAIMDIYSGSRKVLEPARRAARNRYINGRVKELMAAGRASTHHIEYVYFDVNPDPEESTPQEWYQAHPPGMEITDRRLLRDRVNTLNSQMRSLSPADIEMLGWMTVEMQGDANRYNIARQTIERAIRPFQEQGELARSFAAAIAAISAPVYGAINRQSPDMHERIAEYRTQLVDLAASMLDWRGQPSLDVSQAPMLDRLLQEATIKLLLLSEGTSFVPLTASPRNRGAYVAEDSRQRHWDVSVFVSNINGEFSPSYAARFRMGDSPNEASLDECVFTVTPTMLRSAPGRHPLLRSLLRQADGETLSDAENAAVTRARKSLELATRSANLI